MLASQLFGTHNDCIEMGVSYVLFFCGQQVQAWQRHENHIGCNKTFQLHFLCHSFHTVCRSTCLHAHQLDASLTFEKLMFHIHIFHNNMFVFKLLHLLIELFCAYIPSYVKKMCKREGFYHWIVSLIFRLLPLTFIL